MFAEPDKTLKTYHKRKKVLKQKSFLPQDLVELVDFAFHEQLKAMENVSSTLDQDISLPQPEEVLSGKPLLPRDSFPLDREISRDLILKLMRFLLDNKGHLAEAAQIVEREMEHDPEFLDTALDKYLSGDDDFFRSFGEKTPSGPRCLNFLVQTGATPSIVKTADALSLALPRNHTWSQGHCPVCGSLPYIAELREKQGFKYLHCSFCHTAYRFKRMGCPFCATEKSDALDFFHTKEIPGFRVDICNSCNLYIKIIDFREMDKKALPPIDDLESLPLDIKAKEQGHIRPTLSVWGF